MDPHRSARARRVNLVGKRACTAHDQPLGVVAAVVGAKLVVRGKAPARRVHVLPVSAVHRREAAVIHIDRTMEEILHHVQRALERSRAGQHRAGVDGHDER